MNDTVITAETYEEWRKLYIGLLIAGPIFLTTLVVVLFLAIKWHIETCRLERRERENAERTNVQGVYYNNSLRGNGVSFSVPVNDAQLAALDRRAAHSWSRYISDGDYVDVSSIFVRGKC